MGFYEKQSCPTATPTWSGPYSTIDVGRSRADRLFFPVWLDGNRVVAFIDTGAQATALTRAAARSLGVSETWASDRSATARGVTGEVLEAAVHRFSYLQVGGAIVRNPEVFIMDIKLAEGDMILVVDFLRKARLWLSYGSRRIFVSKSGGR
jgi:predicted aspartyl protease